MEKSEAIELFKARFVGLTPAQRQVLVSRTIFANRSDPTIKALLESIDIYYATVKYKKLPRSIFTICDQLMQLESFVII